MAPQQARVLRCCCCSLFQAHQVKKSLKWTCKACGKKQSFLQAYGEGSGADCRRHVQKLNLLQGQISEMSLRSLGESVSANEEENVGPWQAARASPQETLQPSKNRWLKYLERDSKELGLKGGGVCFNSQPSSKTEKPDPPFSTGLPRKRKWNQSTVQPLCGPHVQDSRNCEVTLKSLKVSVLVAMEHMLDLIVFWTITRLIPSPCPQSPTSHVSCYVLSHLLSLACTLFLLLLTSTGSKGQFDALETSEVDQ